MASIMPPVPCPRCGKDMHWDDPMQVWACPCSLVGYSNEAVANGRVVCPHCKRRLIPRTETRGTLGLGKLDLSMYCTKCGRSWPVKEGEPYADIQARINGKAEEWATFDEPPPECPCGGPKGHVPGGIHCRKT